jgi:hypothetical protein
VLDRKWLWMAGSFLVLAAAAYPLYRDWVWPPSFRDRFDRIEAGMSEDQVRCIMGEPGAYKPSSSMQATGFVARSG